jgi:hypothetical protein
MRLLFPIPLKCHNADPVIIPAMVISLQGESQKSYPIVKDEDRALHKIPALGIAAPLDACLEGGFTGRKRSIRTHHKIPRRCRVLQWLEVPEGLLLNPLYSDHPKQRAKRPCEIRP